MMYRIAILQHSPVHLDLSASMNRLTELAHEAKRQKAELAVFGETWLTGYPAWIDHCPEFALWNHEPTKEVYARLVENSVVVGSAITDQIATLSADLAITICVGCHERVLSGTGSGTLYNSVLLFGTDGKLHVHHRKLIPTYTEKLLHGTGDGAGLTVHATEKARIGALICWEHWMPLARQAMHLENEHIHIALWPTVHDMHQVASRSYAFEGRCFVVAAGQIMRVRDFPSELKAGHLDREQVVLRGGSCVIAPDGRYVAEPNFDKEETVLVDIDLTEIAKERMTLDTTGHYQRPDIFDFNVCRQRS